METDGRATGAIRPSGDERRRAALIQFSFTIFD
jgi:hypothetical protein